MVRPNKFLNTEKNTIVQGKCRLAWVHKYIIKSIYGHTDVGIMHFKETLLADTHLHGICLFDIDEIYVAKDQSQTELYLSVLHEIFHYYFRDYQDDSWGHYENDVVEQRAENSAKNMLQWYYKKDYEFDVFKEALTKIKISKLTNEDKELINN